MFIKWGGGAEAVGWSSDKHRRKVEVVIKTEGGL